MITRVENIPITVYRRLEESRIPGAVSINSISFENNMWVAYEDHLNNNLLSDRLSHGLYGTYDAIELCIKLCKIVEGLHANNIIHGDIKPENIIISDTGELTLKGFENSHLSKKETGHDTILLGTLGFAAPEQFGFSRSNEQTDVYAIGVLINIMVTGKYVQSGIVPQPLRYIIKNCVSIDSKKRYPSIRALRMQLEKLIYKEKLYNPFLPPGFRSHHLAKKIIASVGYLSMAALCIALTIDNGAGDMLTSVSIYTFLYLSYLLSIGIICNYLHINEITTRAKYSTPLKIIIKILELFFVNGVSLYLITYTPWIKL